MKIANEIQKNLIDFARGHAYDIVLCNYYFGSYEMDVFKLNDKRWITEYEIKISRSDFKRDFSKSRNKYLYEDDFRNYTTVTTKKHDELLTGECKPNRFYFVVPYGLIDVKELPAHCGLIYYKDGRFTIVKSAKLLHRNPQPIEVYKGIARSLSFRETRFRSEKHYQQYEIQALREQLNSLTQTGNK